jgi:YhcH/YjgK/YiaL family protein
MAEFGKIEDISKKKNNPEWLIRVADFLMKTNQQEVFDRMKIGETEKVEIDGDNIFAIFQKYDSKDGTNPVFEAHRKFIDVQYIHSGNEYILVSSGDGAEVTQPYDAGNDFELSVLKCWSAIRMNSGMAAILYPEDLHAPGIRINQSEPIGKVVVKVSVEQS